MRNDVSRNSQKRILIHKGKLRSDDNKLDNDIDFAMELPATYYGLYVLGLGATETILGAIGLAQFLALASTQFPGGYLADKYGRKWLISTMTSA